MLVRSSLVVFCDTCDKLIESVYWKQLKCYEVTGADIGLVPINEVDEIFGVEDGIKCPECGMVMDADESPVITGYICESCGEIYEEEGEAEECCSEKKED